MPKKNKKVKSSQETPSALEAASFEDANRDHGAAMPLPKMPTLRYRPLSIKPGESGYDDFRRAMRAKFDHFDEGRKGVLSDRDAVHLVVHLFASLHPTQHLSADESRELAGKILKRHGKTAEGSMDFEEFLSWSSTVLEKLAKVEASHHAMNPKDRQLVSEKWYHYDIDGNGRLDQAELIKLAEDLHTAFHPGGAAPDMGKLKDDAALLMKRLDRDHSGFVEFDEFLPWFQRLLDQHRRFLAKEMPVKTLRVRMQRGEPPPPPCSSGEEHWLSKFTEQNRDGGTPLPSAAEGGPVPTYHHALPKAGSKEYEALEKLAKTKFDHYDKGKKGVLNEQDAVALAVDLHKEFKPKSVHLSDADAKAAALKLIRRIDKNADNLIEFTEFLPWYTCTLDQIHRFVDAHDGVDPKVKKLVVEKWDHYDKDKSGYLDESEVGWLAADLHEAFHPGAVALTFDERVKMAALLMHRVDVTHGNGDGRIEFEEFAAWYMVVLKDHQSLMKRNKKEEPSLVIKIEKSEVQRATPPPPLQSSHAPLQKRSLLARIFGKSHPAPSTSVVGTSEPGWTDLPDFIAAKTSTASNLKLAPFWCEMIDVELHARVMMLSSHTSSQEESADIFEVGLPQVQKEISCGGPLISAFNNVCKQTAPTLDKALLQTAQAVKKQHGCNLQLSSSYNGSVKDMPLKRVKRTFAQSKALLIGIHYSAEEKGSLKGSHKAVFAMRDFLIDHHGLSADTRHCRVLIDEGAENAALPSRKNILDGLSWLAAGAKSGDSLYLHFCGHTTRVVDPNQQKEKRISEALVPVDYIKSGLVEDDEIMLRFLALLPPGVDVTIVMDGCQGGAVIQLPYTAKIEKEMISLMPNDKYGLEWTARAQKVCQDWDAGANKILKTMGFPGKIDLSRCRAADVGGRSFAASFPPTPQYKDYTPPPADKHGDFANATFTMYF